MIDSEIIKELLKEMGENLNILAKLREMSLKEFLADPKNSKAAERCLQINIQCFLDICHHIIAGNNWARPRDNREAIEIIARHKIISEKFLKIILPMAGLRNILVHEYIKVNPAIIYRHLKRLQDFSQFQKYILAYLKKPA